MFPWAAALLLALSTCVVSPSVAGPFDEHVGKYKGGGVEYNEDGSVYYFQQTTKVEPGAQLRTVTIPGLATMREYVRFRSNGTLAGSGSATAAGLTLSWTVSGTWRQVDNVVKAQTTTVYQNGETASVRYIYSFREGKLVLSASGLDSEGDAVTISYRGKMTSEDSSVSGAYWYIELSPPTEDTIINLVGPAGVTAPR